MNKNYLFKAVFLTSAIFGSAGASAANSAYNQVFPNVDDTCTYPTLVLNLYAPNNPNWGNTNTKICVDVPVALDNIQLEIAGQDACGIQSGYEYPGWCEELRWLKAHGLPRHSD